LTGSDELEHAAHFDTAVHDSTLLQACRLPASRC